MWKLPEGTRFLQPEDRRAHFEPDGLLRGRVEFEEILAFHEPWRARYTLLRVFEGEIVAAACFEVREADLFVDYLLRNATFHRDARVLGASTLLGALEGLCRVLGRPTIRLECVNDPRSLSWYERVGFVREGAPYDRPGWGFLHPMVKRVQ